MIHIEKNITYAGSNNRTSVLDIFFNQTQRPRPVVIFCHGYKGFKDWGAWDLVAERFAKAGFFFLKFNFSHNGGTVEQPIDFPDLNAFGENNYTRELEDLNSVLDWVTSSDNSFEEHIDPDNITVIGHSRGGGIAVLKAAYDLRIKNVIGWASVSDYRVRFPKNEAFAQWKEEGVFYTLNGRTKQKMPHYFQFYEDFVANESKLTISKAARELKIPYLILHGTKDEAVPLHEAQSLHQWASNSKLVWVDDANHTFGAKHPWEEREMPDQLSVIVSRSITFLNTGQSQ